jgi:hypothetical protein
MGKEPKEGVLVQTEQPRASEDRTRKSEHYHEGLTAADPAATGQAAAKKETRPSQVGESTPEEASSLFSSEETARFRSRWDAIQTGFVDEPHLAVKHADELVAEVINRLAQVFADERAKLEAQLDQNRELSTEDLRLALRHYRSFFARLLSV